ncbi:type III pantothenate kinase [Chitinivorax sp. B]|uniref:type III pantothenate kinase n=1 Tax=Chitinivorax sp. B TaxID=2502235 RepID=UPI0010F67C6D|nr:type III pantothenate kinase [Chitinivorax sp. B]
MWLLIDAGNTRVKWALHDGHAWQARGHALLNQLEQLALQWVDLPPVMRIMAANVAGTSVKTQLTDLLARHINKIEWLTPTHQQLDVHNGYTNPLQLGPDRWAALLGARKLTQGHCLVINIGTAMTVDALTADGHFLGGIIAPGFRLMREALAQGTAELGRRDGQYIPFPTNTADAIHGGIMQALIGTIGRMQHEMVQAGFPPVSCVLSGGDASLLQPHLSLTVIMVDNLVLEGLLRIVRE